MFTHFPFFLIFLTYFLIKEKNKISVLIFYEHYLIGYFLVKNVFTFIPDSNTSRNFVVPQMTTRDWLQKRIRDFNVKLSFFAKHRVMFGLVSVG